MLRIAVPNKGTLSDAAVDVLHEAGYATRRDPKELIVADPRNDVEFFYLRPRDIATYVGSGALDVGITGRDLLLDSHSAAVEVDVLDFGASTFRFAARPGSATTVADFAGKRVATSYGGLLATYFAERGVAAEVVRLDGAVETAVRLGVADVIADVVSTGTTLRQAGLEVVGEPILESEAVLVRRNGVADSPAVSQLVRRMQGVIIARRYVLMDYDIRAEGVEAAVRLTPGIESPTVSPLHDKGWVAVRAMVPRAETNKIMDELWEIGARGILVTDIHACRL
jgi:ATP phosphoribosyltransferase